MEPILKRAAWSLNIAAHGRRPVPGPAESQGFPLTRREKRKAGTQLSNKLASWSTKEIGHGTNTFGKQTGTTGNVGKFVGVAMLHAFQGPTLSGLVVPI